MKIDPTPGQVMWYRPGDEDTIGAAGETLTALVAKVLPDGRVNLLVVDENGHVKSRLNVPLRQEDDKPPKDGKSYCEWMPHQVGQAKKHAETSPPAPPPVAPPDPPPFRKKS